MSRGSKVEAVLGTHESLHLDPHRNVLQVLVHAPIQQHAKVIVALGRPAEVVREAGGDPGPRCTVAVLPVERPVYPETDEVALTRALVGALETLRDNGAFRAIASEIEQRLGALAACAREDRLVAVARTGLAQ